MAGNSRKGASTKTYSVVRAFGAEYTPEGAEKPVKHYFTRQDAHLVPLIAAGKRRELRDLGLILEHDTEDVSVPVVTGPAPTAQQPPA